MKREELKLRSTLLEQSKLALDKMMTDNDFSGDPEAEKLMSMINSKIEKVILNPTPTLVELLAKCDGSAPMPQEIVDWERSVVGNEIGSAENTLALDEFHYHEALDRAYIELSNLENSLGEHPVIESHPELQTLYDEVFDKLGELYQKIGETSHHQKVGSITDLKGIIVPSKSAPVTIGEMKETIKSRAKDKVVSDEDLKKSIEDGRK
jgi:hypothetical protein